MVPEKILLIKPSSFGDIIHTLPVIDALKSAWPESSLTWVVNSPYEALVRLCPLVDDVIPFIRKGASLTDVHVFLRHLRQTRYDLVIDLQCLLRSGLMTTFSRGTRKMGLQDGREGSTLFYSEIIRWNETNLHAVDRYLKTVDHLGLKHPTRVKFPLRIPEGQNFLESHTLKKQEYIVLNPFSRGHSKRWRLGGFAEVIKAFPGRTFVVVGEKSDATEAQSLAGPSVVDLTGRTTLVELLMVLQNSKLLVTNDSGPMHLAVALEVPVVALFSPSSNPALTGPYGHLDQVLTFSADESQAKNTDTGATPFSQQVITQVERNTI
ncbi:MAG: glycosyltransferase family 9 protein [Verrucomicrobiota bacterium]|nr:glycosyltransferase family 9 protein [Verrucomicrobiota bacterium]